MRSGAKTTTPHLVVYRSPLGGSAPQVGIVVSGKYGNAVKRNRVRRRIRAIMYSKIQSGDVLVDVVFRLRSDAGEASWHDVKSEIESLNFANVPAKQNVRTAP